MKLHRFYIAEADFEPRLQLTDEHLNHQWRRVLRFELGTEVVLFNDDRVECLYKIKAYNDNKTVDLELVSQLEPKIPKANIYLCFSLLKKDKNDWIVQKSTELGVTHFVPLYAERCDRTDVSAARIDRWHKIAIEAAEQCGRADIPAIALEPVAPESALKELLSKCSVFVAEQGSNKSYDISKLNDIAIFIGPEGGWSDAEKNLFAANNVSTIELGQFTLRAETAAIVSVTKFW